MADALNKNDTFSPYLKYVLSALRDEKCILCLGPDFYSDPEPGGMRFEQKLATHLVSEAEVLDIRVYDDGWFHALRDDESLAYESVREFYRRHPESGTRAVLKELAQLPFHLILSFTPDYHLREAFKESGIPADFVAYNRQNPLMLSVKPTAKRPLIINLLGELDQRNSLVLTNADYYDFLKSIFEKKYLPEILRNQIADANFILFLGMAFDKWYVQLFTQLVSELDALKKTGAKKIASAAYLDSKTRINIGEQFKLLFSIEQIEPFINALYHACAADAELKSLIRQPATSISRDSLSSSVAIAVNPDEWKKWLANGETELLFDTLSSWLGGLGDQGKNFLNTLIVQQNRWANMKNDLNKGITTRHETETTRNNITVSLLHLLDQIKSTFAI